MARMMAVGSVARAYATGAARPAVSTVAGPLACDACAHPTQHSVTWASVGRVRGPVQVWRSGRNRSGAGAERHGASAGGRGVLSRTSEAWATS